MTGYIPQAAPRSGKEPGVPDCRYWYAPAAQQAHLLPMQHFRFQAAQPSADTSPPGQALLSARDIFRVLPTNESTISDPLL